MLEQEVRFECLRLAAAEVGASSGAVVARANAYADFMLGTVADPARDGEAKQHPLYGEVMKFLVEARITETAFSNALVNSHNFVWKLRIGKTPYARTVAAIRAQMEHYRQHGSFMPRTPRRTVLQAAE